MEQLKKQLYKLCKDHISKRIKELQHAIADLHEAMANETKSSAGDKYETAVRRPLDLATDARRVIEFAVRLPAVDDPRLDLQLLGREDLDPQAVEKPRRIG